MARNNTDRIIFDPEGKNLHKKRTQGQRVRGRPKRRVHFGFVWKSRTR